MKVNNKNKSRLHRKKRIRAKINGTAKNPRLSVFRSLKGMYVQIIDDSKGTTLAFAKLSETKKKNDIDGAKELGKLIAKKCIAKKIEQVIFDRSGYKYHGKIKSLAEGAREGGLKF